MVEQLYVSSIWVGECHPMILVQAADINVRGLDTNSTGPDSQPRPASPGCSTSIPRLEQVARMYLIVLSDRCDPPTSEQPSAQVLRPIPAFHGSSVPRQPEMLHERFERGKHCSEPHTVATTNNKQYHCRHGVRTRRSEHLETGFLLQLLSFNF